MIRNLLRKALLKEGAHKTNGVSYGCVMVFFDYDESEWDKLLDIIDTDDLYEPEGETGFGLEQDPHVTILYGLHADIPDEDIEAEIKKIKMPKIKMNDVSAFENPKFDVLKFDVDSDDLHDLNKKFIKFPYSSDFPKYHPHCTIAYVKPNKSKDYIDKLNAVDEIKFKATKIVYSKADGTKKEYDL